MHLSRTFSAHKIQFTREITALIQSVVCSDTLLAGLIFDDVYDHTILIEFLLGKLTHASEPKKELKKGATWCNCEELLPTSSGCSKNKKSGT